MDLISVIVPIYNTADFLERCVNSLTNQTYKELEIILVDDESTDNSPKICDELAAKDSRIKVIHKKNGGVSAARNSGIDICKGKYISFVDSDDFVNENLYTRLHEEITKAQVDMVCVSYQDVDENGKEFNRNVFKGVELKYDEVYTGEQYAPLIFRDLAMTLVWDKLYKRELIGDTRFQVGITSEEIVFITTIINSDSKMMFIKDKLYYYTTRQNSITAGFNEKFYCDRIKNVFEASNLLNSKFKNVEEDAKIAQLRSIASLLTKMPYNYIKNGNDSYKYTFAKLKENRKFIMKTNTGISIKGILMMFLISKRFTKMITAVLRKMFL